MEGSGGKRERVLAQVEWDGGQGQGGVLVEVLKWRHTPLEATYIPDTGMWQKPSELTSLQYRVNGLVNSATVKRHHLDQPNRTKARKAAVKKMMEDLHMPREARTQVWLGLWQAGVRW